VSRPSMKGIAAGLAALAGCSSALPWRLGRSSGESGSPAGFGSLIRMPIALAIALPLGAGLGFAMIAILAVGGTPEQLAAVYPLERLVPDERRAQVTEPLDDRRHGASRPLTRHADADGRAAAEILPPIDRQAGAAHDHASQPTTPEPAMTTRLMGVDIAGPLPPSGTATDDLSGGSSAPAYRLAHKSADGKAQVAILLRDVGLDPSVAERSVALPDEIMIGMSPYIAHGASWHDYMHRQGHETALMLPLAAGVAAQADDGPLALVLTNDGGASRDQVAHVLERASGFAAVVASAGGFAQAPNSFGPVAERLAVDAVGLIELDGQWLAAPAQSAGLAYASATVALDDQLEPLEIDRKLSRLAAAAKRSGSAIAHTAPYPIVLDRIWTWANELDDEALVLVPVSQLLQTNRVAG